MNEEMSRKQVFIMIFVAGLILTLFNDSIYFNFSIAHEDSLVFSSIIAIFGGAGFLVELYKKE